MKKFFSIFLSFVLVFFSSFCPSKSYACESANGTVTEISSTDSSLSYDGIKNIINHPFKILLRGGLWGFLGLIVGPFTPCGRFCIVIGASSGIVSKIIELYEEGCNAK